MTEQEIIDWLLDSDPSIRWQVIRDLLGETFTQESIRISTVGWGADLLSRKDTTGRWAGQLYDHKWISTTYTMQLLRRMGLDPEHPQAHKACQQLLEGGYKKGGALSFAKTVSHIDLGVNGLVLSILAYFRYPDPRVHAVVEFLLDQQQRDGSWLPELGLERLQYIFAGTMLVLDGLREYEKRYTSSSAQVIDAQIKGREFLLSHNLFKFRGSNEIIDQKLTRFSFPPRWHYDVLVALDYFQDCRAEKDARLNDAIELLKSKCRKDGRWNLQNRHPGKNTLRWKWLVNRAGGTLSGHCGCLSGGRRAECWESFADNMGRIQMNGSKSSWHEISPEDRRAIYKWILQAALGVVAYGVIIFLAAGTLDWVWGWVLLGLLAAFLAAHPLILVPINPELLAERGKGIRDEGVKNWDKYVAPLAGGVMPLISWIVAGMDVRFGWTGPVPLVYHLFGLLGFVLGFGLFLWAMASNAFFSEGVRIQEERGHTVATGGPYQYVRHPGYSGAILAQLSTPLMLGSPWVMIPSLASAALYIARTVLEDKTLVAELPGYNEYTRQTRYRLLPGIW